MACSAFLLVDLVDRIREIHMVVESRGKTDIADEEWQDYSTETGHVET
jgi:hypothetical protein